MKSEFCGKFLSWLKIASICVSSRQGEKLTAAKGNNKLDDYDDDDDDYNSEDTNALPLSHPLIPRLELNHSGITYRSQPWREAHQRQNEDHTYV